MTKTIAGYVVLRALGQGAAGQVYLARDPKLDRLVALKVLRHQGPQLDGNYARFIREARLFAKVSHPAVLPVLAADLDRSPPFLVFQHMAGGDLADEIGAGKIDIARIMSVGARLADGLQALHEAGILHRDIKPANILLDEDGAAYLGDLGLGQGVDETKLTATGFVVGTPRYMAPESLEEASYSPASDVFSLAATLLQMTLGALPHYPAELASVTGDIKNPALRSILRRGLRRLPETRYVSAAEFAGALRGIADTEAGAVVRPQLSDETLEVVGKPPVAPGALDAPPAPTPPWSWVAAGWLSALVFGELLARGLVALL